MSRSALVTMRWSNTKLPLSEPATTRSQGSQCAQVLQREDLLQRLARARPGHAHGHPQPERVEVAVERVGLAARPGPPQLGQVVSTNSSRSASGLPVPVGRDVERQQHRQLLARARARRRSRLAVDDRDRRSPRALAGDREVVGAIAHRRARSAPPVGRAASVRGARPRSAARSPLAPSPAARSATRRRQQGARRSARRCGRARESPSTAVAPKRPSTTGEISTGSGSPPAARAGVRPVSISGIASASRELRSRPPERSSSRRSRTRGSPPSVDVGVLGRDQHEAGQLERVGVGGEHASSAVPSAAAQVDLDAVHAAEHEALAGERVLVPGRCRRARPGGGRSPARTRSCADTTAGAGSGARGCGSASTGRPRPGSWRGSSGRCRTSRRCPCRDRPGRRRAA